MDTSYYLFFRKKYFSYRLTFLLTIFFPLYQLKAMNLSDNSITEQISHDTIQENIQENQFEELSPEEELQLKELISIDEWKNATIKTKLTLAIEVGLSDLLIRLWPLSSKNDERLQLSNADNTSDSHSISLLYYAYIRGDITIIEALEALGGTFSTTDWHFNLNLLDLVVAQGHSHMICYILNSQKYKQEKKDAFLVAKSNRGFTPLTTAVKFSYADCIKELLKVTTSNESMIEKILAIKTTETNNTALDLAIIQNDTNCLKILLNHDKRKDFSSALLKASLASEEHNSSLILEQLLSHIEKNKNSIIEVNNPQEKNITPLLKMLENIQTDHALRLLSLIQEKKLFHTLNLQDDDQKYAVLHIAILLKNKKISEALLKIKEVDVNLLAEDNSHTILDCALNNYLEFLPNLLMRKDLKIAKTGNYGISALSKALILKEKNLNTALLLLENHKKRMAQGNKKKLSSNLYIFSDEQILESITQCYKIFSNITDDLTNNNQLKQVALFIKKASELIPQRLIDDSLKKRYDINIKIGKNKYEQWLKKNIDLEEQSFKNQIEKAEILAKSLCNQEEKEKIIKDSKNKKRNKKNKNKASTSEQPKTTTTITTSITKDSISSLSEMSTSSRLNENELRETESLSREIQNLDINNDDKDFSLIESKNKKKKAAKKAIPYFFIDEKIFSFGPATLYLHKENIRNSNDLHIHYLKNYENNPHVQSQQDNLDDYHTFTHEVEQLWGDYATSKEEDIETRLMSNFFDTYGVSYTKKIKYKIRGFINNTAGSFEFILLIPSEKYSAEHKPLCIHRFFAPEHSLAGAQA